ncbi:uncharacterized protein PpBr36_05646 [Pyricularia pennisetigena]|uniref:uncharacterized protein n=1 Tax=Pyricularia pennisetigena TaxID=1578925 RepID=UPI00114F111D|nr:uncharacterized protein PpBr36_05646 [Pyricularia pennisetigena]TLS22768.1 hypothetical protein PpBr36_05646 [Pyricularia pennisetigena]
MLSRSGFTIRKLVRQAPRTSLDSDDSGTINEAMSRPASQDEQSEKLKNRTWRRTKRPPPPILVIHRSENIHLISNPLPPLPDTPHSTSSSLQSCDYRSSPKTPASKGSPHLCAIVPNGSPSLSPHLSHSGGKHPHILSAATDDARKFQPSLPTIITMPDNIEKSIRETNKALDEASMAVQSPGIPALPRGSMVDSPVLSPPGLSPSRPSPKMTKYSSSQNLPIRRASVTKANRKPAKIGRQKSVQSRQKQQRQPKKTSKVAAKWTLGENVGRLFHRIEVDEMVTSEQVKEWRQKNPRVEDDQPADDAVSVDSLRIFDLDLCETPVEPFHLDDLPTRIGAAGVRTWMPPSLNAHDSFDVGLDVIHEDFLLANGPQRPQTQPPRPKPLPSAVVEENEMTFQDVSFPTPPPKTPRRASSPRRQLPPLPTIPESATVSPVDVQPKPFNFKQMRKRSVRRGPEMKQTKVADEYIYLPATPFTATMPTYLHGPIRLSKADVRLRSPMQPFVDETLDWTAFQMAILGAPGDFMGDSDDGEDEKQANDLVNWYEDFNLGHGGKMLVSKEEEDEYMVRAEVKPVAKKSRTSRAARHAPSLVLPQQVDIALTVPLPPSPTTANDVPPASALGSPQATVQPEMIQIRRVPIPLIVERPSGGGWNARFEFGLGRWVSDEAKEECEQQEEPLQGEIKERIPSLSSSVGSMPQSPMLDLVVSRAVTGEDYVVPMGYNLGHDLGDFLKWEAENVSLAASRA